MKALMNATLLLLVMNLPCFAQREGRNTLPVTRVSLDTDHIDLHGLAKFFYRYRPGGVVYNDSIFQGHPYFSIHVHNVPLDSLYHLLLDPLRIRVIDDGKTLILLRTKPVRVCRLQALDDQGKVMARASVNIFQENDPVQGMTDDNGLLFFAVDPAPFSLRITHVGFRSYGNYVPDPVSRWTVVLKRDLSELDAATITSYGIVTTIPDNTSSSPNVRLPESEKESNDNIQEALKGRVTGLAITEVNGVPNGGQIIHIRGQNSIANGNSPLVVIDGIPVYLGSPGTGNTTTPSAQGLAGISPLSAFSTNMIGATAVLKGAASTAIYGSRGANGVLVLNTLIDTAGSIKWSLNFNTGASWIVPIQSPLRTHDYLALREAAIRNDSLSIGPNTLPEAYQWDSTRYTNFKRLLIGNPGAQFDLSGRFLKKDATGYLALNGWLHRESTVFFDQPADNRGTAAVHFLRHPSGHHYALQGSMLVTLDDQHLPTSDYTSAVTVAPNTPAPYDPTGRLAFQLNGLPFTNYKATALNTYEALAKALFIHGQWTDTLQKNLILKLSGGFNGSGLKETVSLPAAAQDPATGPFSITGTNKTSFNTVVVDPMIGYGRKIHKKDSIDALLGFSWQQQSTSFSYLTTEYGINAPVSANAGPLQTGNRLVYRYEAVFGRVHYSYDSSYTVDLSFRRDGSSRFGPGRQFGNFWAIGTGWTFSRNRLLKGRRVLSFGRVRANYGTVGNDQIGDYQYLSLWNSSGGQLGYRGAPALTPVTAYNPNLEWEVQHQFEGGLDLGLLNNRIFLYMSYFRDWSGNQLLYSGLSGQTGMQGVMTNLPVRVLNRGLEIEGSFHLLSIRRWQWNMSWTLTVPENKLVSFPGLASSLYSNQLTIGKPLSELTGYVSTGVNAGSGLFTFLSNQGGKVITSIGNTEMHYYGGVNNSITFNAFTFDLFLEYRNQHGLSPFPQIYRRIDPGMADPSALSNQLIDPHWYWKQPGDQALLQKPTATPGTAAYSTINAYVNSSAQIGDASFIRFKTVTFTYRPGRRFLKKFGCKEGKVFIEGKNILTITHYLVTDPETQSPFTLPPLRTIRCGIHVKF